MVRNAWCPFAEKQSREQENTGQIERGRERAGSAWTSLPLSPLAQMSARLKDSGTTHFFRLVRQRAAYFADVGDIPPNLALDELPTQHASAHRRAIEAIATQPESQRLAGEPTGLLQACGRV
jgi:hypothetical protein